MSDAIERVPMERRAIERRSVAPLSSCAMWWRRGSVHRASVGAVVQISSGRGVCTVVVTVDADAEVLDEMLEHARRGVTTYFGECEGFVAGAVHLSADRTRLVQYLQWESEAAYLRCRDDPKWDRLDSTRIFLDHVAAGRAVVDARLYEVLADSGPGNTGAQVPDR